MTEKENLSCKIRVFIAPMKNSIIGPDLGNPGVGGTEYMAVLLCYYLAVYFPENKVSLTSLTDCTITMRECPANLDFATGIDGDEGSETHIVLFNASKLYWERTLTAPFYLWSHNLWDVVFNKALVKAAAGVVVCSDIQTLIAGVVCGYETVRIQYPITLESIPFFERPRTSNLEVVCLGTKGLSDVLKIWSSTAFKYNATLHVIGGNDLYATRKQTGPSREMEKGSSSPANVIFHGVLGPEKWNVIAQCSYAIHNPLGRTECFPNALIEVMAAGLPVVTTAGWGNGEIVSKSDGGAVPTRWHLRSRLQIYLAKGASTPEARRSTRARVEALIKSPKDVATDWMNLMKGSRPATKRSRVRQFIALNKRQPDFVLALMKNYLVALKILT